MTDHAEHEAAPALRSPGLATAKPRRDERGGNVENRGGSGPANCRAHGQHRAAHQHAVARATANAEARPQAAPHAHNNTCFETLKHVSKHRSAVP